MKEDPINRYTTMMIAQAERDKAKEQYNYAGQLLENKQIKARLAEIYSQIEPMESLLSKQMHERDRLYAIAYYVVVGRLPE